MTCEDFNERVADFMKPVTEEIYERDWKPAYCALPMNKDEFCKALKTESGRMMALCISQAMRDREDYAKRLKDAEREINLQKDKRLDLIAACTKANIEISERARLIVRDTEALIPTFMNAIL